MINVSPPLNSAQLSSSQSALETLLNIAGDVRMVARCEDTGMINVPPLSSAQYVTVSSRDFLSAPATFDLRQTGRAARGQSEKIEKNGKTGN